MLTTSSQYIGIGATARIANADHAHPSPSLAKIWHASLEAVALRADALVVETSPVAEVASDVAVDVVPMTLGAADHDDDRQSPSSGCHVEIESVHTWHEPLLAPQLCPPTHVQNSFP